MLCDLKISKKDLKKLLDAVTLATSNIHSITTLEHKWLKTRLNKQKFSGESSYRGNELFENKLHMILHYFDNVSFPVCS